MLVVGGGAALTRLAPHSHTTPNTSKLLQEAEAAERSTPAAVETCRAIVSAVVGLGVDDEDRKRTWVADAEECLKRGSVETARAIYAAALAAFPGKKGVWRRAAELEKAHGTRDALDALLRRADATVGGGRGKSGGRP